MKEHLQELPKHTPKGHPPTFCIVAEKIVQTSGGTVRRPAIQLDFIGHTPQCGRQ